MAGAPYSDEGREKQLEQREKPPECLSTCLLAICRCQRSVAARLISGSGRYGGQMYWGRYPVAGWGLSAVAIAD